MILTAHALYCAKPIALKRYTFLLLCLFYMAACFGQDTVSKRNWLSNEVLERYKVIKGNENVRVGPYKAYYKRHTIVADGNYTKGQKTGLWSFYDDEGKLMQKYDFDKTEFIYEAPLDTDTDVTYAFDSQVKAGDRLTRPVKIGGNYYGLIPYITSFRLPFETDGINVDYIDAVVELLVSPAGRLADYKVHLISRAYNYKQSFNFGLDLFNEEDKQFSPATLNRIPILSRIFIHCSVNNDGSLDFY